MAGENQTASPWKSDTVPTAGSLDYLDQVFTLARLTDAKKVACYSYITCHYIDNMNIYIYINI